MGGARVLVCVADLEGVEAQRQEHRPARRLAHDLAGRAVGEGPVPRQGLRLGTRPRETVPAQMIKGRAARARGRERGRKGENTMRKLSDQKKGQPRLNDEVEEGRKGGAARAPLAGRRLTHWQHRPFCPFAGGISLRGGWLLLVPFSAPPPPPPGPAPPLVVPCLVAPA